MTKKLIYALALLIGLAVFEGCAKTQKPDNGDNAGDVEENDTTSPDSGIDQYFARFEANGPDAEYTDNELNQIEDYVRTLIPECIEQTDKFADGFDNYFMKKYGHKYDFLYYPEIPYDINGIKAIIPEAGPWEEYMATGNGLKLFSFLYILDRNDRDFFGGSNRFKSKENFYLNSIYMMSASGAPDIVEMLDGILHLRTLGSMEKLREYYDRLMEV